MLIVETLENAEKHKETIKTTYNSIMQNYNLS